MDDNKIYEKLDKLDEKIERKLDKLDTRQDSVEKQLIVYNEELKTHIQGVTQLREANKLMKEYIDIEVGKLSSIVEPIKKSLDDKQAKNDFIYNVYNTAIKTLGLISACVGIAYGLFKIISGQ